MRAKTAAMSRFACGLFGLSLAVFLCPPSAGAAALKGKVSASGGKPAYGAMVTVSDAARERRETVYTAEDGSFAIRTPYAGELEIRARLAGFADATLTRTVAASEIASVDLELKPFKTPEAASDALSASAFNARLPWRDVTKERPAFISQCNYCHQVGNATTRIPKSHEQWMATLDKMEKGLMSLLSAGEKATIADVLARGFDGKPLVVAQSYGASPTLARAKVKEWLVGDGYTFVHDAMVGHDQRIYSTDEGHDILWVLDRTTGKLERNVQPDIDLPRGGMFSGIDLPIGTFTGKHGPHSMAETSDGRIWITNALSGTLMSFDPKSRAWRTYGIPDDPVYPHTVRVDRRDIVWFTIAASNQIGRFDPKTETFRITRLPSNGIVRWVSQELFPTLLRIGSWFPHQAYHLNISTHPFFGERVLPFPYGIDINPKDGSVWYAKLYAGKIGRLDPETFEVEEWDTPMKGPRRPRFDKDGILWIPAFDEGGLMRYDPVTKEFQSWKIPSVGLGEYETPYALNVETKSGEIWMAANNSDRVLRFSPVSKTFMSYPSPTRVTVLRDFSFAADGSVCSSSSNLPAYAIEGGRAALLCIEPDGGAKDREALGVW